ncbi:hypothetical protein ACFZBU_29970 [Embleya sp. NPDC008237]|uniref:hypothetical protein n=1 Tax=Embleya sp. NPDC008237 TaxID=3363978 RepID=UPI0036F16C37
MRVARRSTTATRTGRRLTAAFAGTALAITGLAALAPTASATQINPTVKCSLPAGQGTATGVQAMDVTFTPAVAAPGATVTAKVTLGPSPATSPLAMTVPTTPTIDLAMSGGATGTVTVVGPLLQIPVQANTPIQTPPYSGTFVVPTNAAGPVTFSPIRTLTYTKVLGSNYETPCVITSGGGAVGSITVTGGPGTPATLDAPTTDVRPGTAVPLSGAVWTPNATANVQLCDASGGGCNPGAFTAKTLVIDAAGNLSGTATLAGTTADGSYRVKVLDGTKEASAPITVKKYVPSGPLQISITPNRGPVGTEVTVSGKNFPANETVSYALTDSGGVPDESFYATSTPDGTFTGTIPIYFDTASAVLAWTGSWSGSTPFASAPFTVATDPPTVSASPTTSHPGGSVTVTGANWTPNATVTAQLCTPNGATCSSAQIAQGPGAADANGNLNGTVKLASSGIADGQYTLKLTDGTGTASTPLSVQRRWIELDKTSGPAGSWVKVSGHGFGASAWINVNGLNASGGKTSDWAGAWALPNGEFCIWIWMTRGDNTGIVAAETFHPDRKASTAWTVTP